MQNLKNFERNVRRDKKKLLRQFSCANHFGTVHRVVASPASHRFQDDFAQRQHEVYLEGFQWDGPSNPSYRH